MHCQRPGTSKQIVGQNNGTILVICSAQRWEQHSVIQEHRRTHAQCCTWRYHIASSPAHDYRFKTLPLKARVHQVCSHRDEAINEIMDTCRCVSFNPVQWSWSWLEMVANVVHRHTRLYVLLVRIKVRTEIHVIHSAHWNKCDVWCATFLCHSLCCSWQNHVWPHCRRTRWTKTWNFGCGLLLKHEKGVWSLSSFGTAVLEEQCVQTDRKN